MNYELIIRNRAQTDIAEIMLWYEDNERGLGKYFLLCLDASLESMIRFPTAPRVVWKEYRRVFVRKFPVGFYYIDRGNRIYVDAVESFHRNPERLTKRFG